MGVINITLEELKQKNKKIMLGYEGENKATEVRFDCSAAFAEYPDAIPALTVQPPMGGCIPRYY